MLRVEDTDRSRERPEYRDEIFRALRWLGITEDEGPNAGGAFGPYVQSERTERYVKALAKLQAAGRVYPCFCTIAASDESADDTAQDDEPRGYEDRSSRCRCRALSPIEAEERTAALGMQPAMRMHIDASVAHEVDDMIRGQVIFPPGEVEDFIISKAGGDPLYNFVAVVDDAAMEITHVIRGEEHLANTPKQILLHRALGHEPPRFAHLPIILNTERKKLSKRDGATAVSEYESQGFLPEALRNFLVLLGWSPGDDREVLTLDEMVKSFDLARVQKHGAVFDTVKLTWMNGEYVRKADLSVIVAALETLIAQRPSQPALRYDRDHLRAVAEVVRERIKTVTEILDLAYFFTRETTITWDEASVAKRAGTSQARVYLADVRKVLAPLGTFNRTTVETAIRALAADSGVKAGDYIAPLRVAITGTAVSPGIFEVCEVIGHEIVLGRVDAFLQKYHNEGS